jgi:Sec-independent protein translocase protein TatA
MNTKSRVLWILFILIIGILGFGTAKYTPELIRDYKTLQTRLEQTINEVTKTWRIESLETQASTELKDLIKKNKVESRKLFYQFSQTFGQIKKIESSQIEWRYKSGTVYAEVTTIAQFEKENGTIKTLWSKKLGQSPLQNNSWVLHNFIITPQNPSIQKQKTSPDLAAPP